MKRFNEGAGGRGQGLTRRFPFSIPLSPILSFVLILGLIAGFIAYAVQIAPQAAPPPWSANTRLFGDLGPSSQGEPVVALNGNTSLVAWTDERNSLPDIYAKVGGSAQSPDAAEKRITGPLSDDQWMDTAVSPRPDTSASAQVEANGRAFVAYSTHASIVLARREPNGSWLSRTLMTEDRGTWYADAREPSLIANGGNDIVAVWQDYRNENWDIYSARCNGATMVCQANVKVSDDTTDEWQVHPRLATNGSTLIAVWEDLRENGAERSRIYASFSTDGGASWSANAPVDAGTAAATDPNVAYEPGGQPWVVWESHADEAATPADLYVARWSGSAWGTPTQVNTTSRSGRALNPSIAMRGSAGNATPFVAWEDYRNGPANPDIYTAYWTGSGWVEGAAGAAVNAAGAQTKPALAASGDTLRLAWQDGRNGQADVFAAEWNGTTWTNATQLNETVARTSLQTMPVVQATVWGDLYVVWRDTRVYDNSWWVSRYAHDTKQWSNPIAVPTKGEGRYDVANEKVAAAVDSDGHLHAIWSQYSDGGLHIWYSEFDGLKWGPVARLSPDGPDQNRNQLSISFRNGRMAAAWVMADTSQGWPYISTIYVSEFNFSAGTWGAPMAVNNAPMRGDPKPSLALDDAGTIYVAYSEYTYEGGLKGNVKVAKKPFGGGTWSLFKQVNSADTTSSENWCYHEQPQLAVVGSALHVVWLGCVPWTRGVYYSTSTDGGNTWSATSLKLAQADDSGLQPVLAANPIELSVVYPDVSDHKFHAAALRGGAWYTGTVVSDGATNLSWGEDGLAGLAYDPGQRRFVTVFADRRTRAVPQLYLASLGSEYQPPPPPPTPTLPPGVTPTGPENPNASPTPYPTPDLTGLGQKIFLPVTVR